MNNSHDISPNAGAFDDGASREAIRTQLDTTMLVEAGAGSGKTTLMVDRLLAYIERGTSVDQLAAVTFTRKAANELRQRLESQIEKKVLESDGATRDRFATALRDRERMFIGTVHAFCGRILREYALEAGLPPDFEELDENETALLRSNSWREFIERAVAESDPLLIAALAVGVDPLNLRRAFDKYEQYRDVTFPAERRGVPDHASVRDALLSLMAEANDLRTGNGKTERDKLQRALDRLSRNFAVHEAWQRAPEFALDAQTLLSSGNLEIVQKHWGDTKEAKTRAKEFAQRLADFVTSQLSPWFERWWAHVYAPAIALLKSASEAALERRRHSGNLGFDDLLTETAALLRSSDATRRAIGERWRYLLVDEFQDTDPVQAEVCFLIASDPSEGNDWRCVALRPGSLFVVGDPKQSIYRFRRADLAMYQLVQQRIAECGTVEHLTRNFRSVAAIGTLVNEHFRNVFISASEADDSLAERAPQAPFAEFVAASTRAVHNSAGLYRYQIGQGGRETNEKLLAEDSQSLASWIAGRCASGDRRPQDFLILTTRKQQLTAYAHELVARNIPVSVTGAPGSVDAVLGELLVVLQAIADPSNPIAVIAALEGWCVGCSHADLWDAREAGIPFSIVRAPSVSSLVASEGLELLHRWWLASQRLPVATLVEQVLNESGLLIVAASSKLGDTSAGRIVQLVYALQTNEGSDLSAAIELMTQSIHSDDVSASLRPPRADSVRIMNLHKAKGLEAKVVVLAAPIPPRPREPDVATWREHGGAVGALHIIDDGGNTLARPIDWEDRCSEESVRTAAEWDRLLYVAVTRAEEELVVSQRASYTLSKGELREDTSRWAPLRDVLAKHAVELELSIDAPAGRAVVTSSASQVRAEIADAEARLSASLVPHYELISVTEEVKRSAQQAEDDGSPLAPGTQTALHAASIDSHAERRDDAHSFSGSGSGIDPRVMGSLVHLAIEGALRGRRGDALTEYVNALVWHELSNATDPERQALVSELLLVVDEARETESWKRLTASSSAPLAELNVASYLVREGSSTLTEGVIDAAAETDGEWTVVDWKLNRSSDVVWASMVANYERQAGTYVEMLRIKTDRPGSARIERLRGGSGRNA